MRKKLSIIILLCILASLLFSPAALSQDYQVIRVLLTNLNVDQQVHIGVYGGYSVDGILSFQRGSDIVVSAENNTLMLYHEGLAYNGGKELLFTRHGVPSDQENGLRLQHGLNLYEGNLSLSLQEGKIQPILHIAVEDYLKGVVPYEMNEAFPAEALKAQAVAARTYALRNLKPNKQYDVVDNTNDQVYRGFLAQHTNALKAVEETSGICGMFEGKLAMCYYTASNGGQTESPKNVWGGGSIKYLPIQDDPYDLKNPESIVRRALIEKKSQDHLIGTPELTAYIKDKLQPVLEKRGYNPQSDTFYIDEVASVVAQKPKYGNESRVMTELEFSLHVAAQRRYIVSNDQEVSLYLVNQPVLPPASTSSAQPQWLPAQRIQEAFIVHVPIFPDAEKALQLSINLKENEIFLVEESTDAFSLSMQRYGHGVGMSQRGAQQMAQEHGWDYQQILKFYYPGMELKAFNTTRELSTALPAQYLSTPGPVPTATPRPTLMPQSITPGENQYVVAVTGVAMNSTLNLRSQPNMVSDVIMQLFYGQELLVVGKKDDGWLQVKTDVAEGYVMEKFVNVKE